MEERIVNKLDSGMPRWLIEVGFLLMLVQAATTETNVDQWLKASGLHAVQAFFFLAGDIILYYGMLKGMKPLKRPYTWLWWTLLAVDTAGCITSAFPATEILSLAFALALPLVLLPLGISITFFYRGTLQWVGILMIAHMITMIVFPIMLDALLPAIVTDSIAIIVLVAYAWAMRKVLV